MRVKVIWPQPIWLNEEEVKNWQETDVDEATARMLEAKKMVVIMDTPAPAKGRPRKESADA
jgi:hypothetical protein